MSLIPYLTIAFWLMIVVATMLGYIGSLTIGMIIIGQWKMRSVIRYFLIGVLFVWVFVGFALVFWFYDCIVFNDNVWSGII